MRIFAALCLTLSFGSAYCETPEQIGRKYITEATAQQPAFAASAKRGSELFRQRFTVNDKMPSCTSCHTDNPLNPGQHAVTGKSIKPLAIAANRERFSDPAKVEKWFGRNCREVLGRECTPAEKADFVVYMSEVR